MDNIDYNASFTQDHFGKTPLVCIAAFMTWPIFMVSSIAIKRHTIDSMTTILILVVCVCLFMIIYTVYIAWPRVINTDSDGVSLLLLPSSVRRWRWSDIKDVTYSATGRGIPAIFILTNFDHMVQMNSLGAFWNVGTPALAEQLKTLKYYADKERDRLNDSRARFPPG